MSSAEQRAATKLKWCTKDQKKCEAASERLWSEYDSYAKTIGYRNLRYFDDQLYISYFLDVRSIPTEKTAWPPAGVSLPECKAVACSSGCYRATCKIVHNRCDQCQNCKIYDHTRKVWEWGIARNMFLNWVNSVHSC
jgi:hypothetical protein